MGLCNPSTTTHRECIIKKLNLLVSSVSITLNHLYLAFPFSEMEETPLVLNFLYWETRWETCLVCHTATVGGTYQWCATLPLWAAPTSGVPHCYCGRHLPLVCHTATVGGTYQWCATLPLWAAPTSGVPHCHCGRPLPVVCHTATVGGTYQWCVALPLWAAPTSGVPHCYCGRHLPVVCHTATVGGTYQWCVALPLWAAPTSGVPHCHCGRHLPVVCRTATVGGTYQWCATLPLWAAPTSGVSHCHCGRHLPVVCHTATVGGTYQWCATLPLWAAPTSSVPHCHCGRHLPVVCHTATVGGTYQWCATLPLWAAPTSGVPHYHCNHNHSPSPTGNFTCLEIVFTFKRRLGYYLFHTYIPTCLIVIMSWISFWIRPEAVPARVTLGVTSLLTLSTQHANSQKSLPPVSYIKAIDVFMSSCTVFVFFSLMEYALVNVVLGDVPEDPTTARTMRPRTLLQVTGQQDSPKKLTECLGGARQDFEESPSRSKKTDAGQPITATRRSPAVQRRANGRKSICQSELEAISTITSPAAPSPSNGLSPLEMLAQTSCPAHLSSSPHVTTSQMVNGPMYSGMQHAGMQHPGIQHAGIQYPGMQHTFGVPPPPPPPPLGPAKAPKNQRRRRERAILIDRVSRILFPTSFTVLNIIYWCVFFVEWF
ncbi:uncharacterized protein [Procambarus clarkii]|uniref:uncharacterized protein n=1 Tax=Procambarus clarkii TaxID=6728 RepID=UPI00374377C0